MSATARRTTERVPRRHIRRTVREIVEEFGPERGVLFGLGAYGRPSDEGAPWAPAAEANARAAGAARAQACRWCGGVTGSRSSSVLWSALPWGP